MTLTCVRKILATLTALLVLASNSLHANALFDKFIDPTDGQFDTRVSELVFIDSFIWT